MKGTKPKVSEQNYVSNELTHFLGRNEPTDEDRYQLLLKVLRRGWLTQPPHVEAIDLKMELNPGTSLATNELLAPNVVCFADIPADQFQIHMGKYSRFGIAFSKDTLVKKRATPVMYVALESPVLRLSVEHRVGMNLIEETAVRETDLNKMEAVPRVAVIDEAIVEHAMLVKDIALTERRGGLEPEVASLLRRMTAVNAFIIGVLYPFIKGFRHELPDSHEENVYMEREWRVLGNVQFSLEEVTRIIVPREYETRLRQDVPQFTGVIQVV